ncbi:MAG: type IV pilus twitching motility protein PilT [Armatimonadetes bacterium]|nr:type IV pilus twitching motility protein PilT [Armatimonadota bacterium]
MDMAELLIQTLERGASDLHIAVGTPPAIRVHGDIERLASCPALTGDDAHDLIYQVMNDYQRARFEETGDLDFSLDFGSQGRFRVNSFKGRSGCGAVFRVIPSRIKSIQELGMPEVISRLADYERGLVLVTGPTGSGKSTTLAALIDQINSNGKGHILTIEDPIEFVHQHKQCVVNQREVGSHTASFATALRAALREDPDVILVGEMRDLETIALACTAAETGHLVFGTLHTSSAAQTVDRIIDVFPTHQQAQIRTQLSASLRGVVAQTLVRTCDGTGRAAVVEVLVSTPAVRNLIREGKTFQLPSIIQTGTKEGMITIEASLYELLKKGRITREEALSKAPDREQFIKLLEEHGAGTIGDPDRVGTPSLEPRGNFGFVGLSRA